MSRDTWIVERQTVLKSDTEYEDIISKHTGKEHHSKLDILTDQLNGLKDVGFKDVDCFYKYGIFAMYGGRK